MVDLTISIVNHWNCKLLEPLLASIFQHTRQITFEVYVVDNASKDGSVEMVRDKFPQVKLIANNEPRGFAQNNNQVLRRFDSRYIILLNDDMLLHEDTLSRLVAYLDHNPQVGAVGSRLLRTDGSTQRSCWHGFPSPTHLFVELFYLSVLFPQSEWVRKYEATLDTTNEPVSVDHLLGACLMVRREVVDRIGLIDESFGMFLEETDWCYRMQAHGWKIMWHPTGAITHYGQQSTSGDPQRFKPMLYRNYCLFYRKHNRPHPTELFWLKVILSAGLLFRAFVWGIRGLRKPEHDYDMFFGYLNAVRQIPSY